MDMSFPFTHAIPLVASKFLCCQPQQRFPISPPRQIGMTSPLKYAIESSAHSAKYLAFFRILFYTMPSWDSLPLDKDQIISRFCDVIPDEFQLDFLNIELMP